MYILVHVKQKSVYVREWIGMRVKRQMVPISMRSFISFRMFASISRLLLLIIPFLPSSAVSEYRAGNQTNALGYSLRIYIAIAWTDYRACAIQ